MAETDRHRDLMTDMIQILKGHYKHENDVYVTGNIFLYYEEGNPYKVISPDVFVAFGVEKKLRNTFLTWNEGKTPDFVLEVASPGTFRDDMGKKKDLYESVLSVQEYYIYDPLGQIMPSFSGYRLIDGKFREINFVNDRLPSEVLGLELGEQDGVLRLYNSHTSEWLRTPPERAEQAENRAEQAENRAEQAENRAEQAENRAEQEGNARQNAEMRAEQEGNARQNAEMRAENAEAALVKALEALERLKAEGNN